MFYPSVCLKLNLSATSAQLKCNKQQPIADFKYTNLVAYTKVFLKVHEYSNQHLKSIKNVYLKLSYSTRVIPVLTLGQLLFTFLIHFRC